MTFFYMLYVCVALHGHALERTDAPPGSVYCDRVAGPFATAEECRTAGRHALPNPERDRWASCPPQTVLSQVPEQYLLTPPPGSPTPK